MTAPTTRETADHSKLQKMQIGPDHIGDEKVTADHAELAACPFCGPGESIVEPWFDEVVNRWRVGCGRCGCSTGHAPREENDSKHRAVEAWNRRAPDQANLLSEIAALRASDARTGELLAESNLRESRATVRATQAERQRDELRKALELAAKRFETLRDLTDHVPHRIACSTWADEARQANQGADQ